MSIPAAKHICFTVGLFFIFVGQSLFAQEATYADSLLYHRTERLQKIMANPTAPLDATDWAHLHHFEADSQWRLWARVEILADEEPFLMPTYAGTENPYKRYARLHFLIEGQPQTLTLYQSANQPDDNSTHLFLPFSDRTNGPVTYGGGRYLDLRISDIQDGFMWLDFNRAYNPYCAYSNGYRCPIPPAENHLKIPVSAGEKNYTGSIKERKH